MRRFTYVLIFFICIMFTSDAEAYQYKSIIATQAALMSMEKMAPAPVPIPKPEPLPEPEPGPEPEPTPVPKPDTGSKHNYKTMFRIRR